MVPHVTILSIHTGFGKIVLQSNTPPYPGSQISFRWQPWLSSHDGLRNHPTSMWSKSLPGVATRTFIPFLILKRKRTCKNVAPISVQMQGGGGELCSFKTFVDHYPREFHCQWTTWKRAVWKGILKLMKCEQRNHKCKGGLIHGLGWPR